ncbi:GntR family transcriptional regulator [Ornithinibacillus gellani]|uniref:GntR family transcriptional regulator n=1 Tax=Ornithinibacillus gellani TaxID=2293253 RepID=UPI000F47445B|nr:GntR family transcriptional regulator [Ornithinibacillus gellani]TQS71046.1 GntR family transcriptional regulator [Ornithinibacillus gellani]
MPIPTDHLKSTKLTAKESAYNQLQQWIIDGTLHPGEKLNDTEIAQALGVSRTPVRESLQLLEVDGFVKMYPGKATQVTEVDRDSISDLLPPLAVLQALAAELAIPQLNDELIHLLQETNKRFAEAVRAENYFSALKIDEEFHQLIVDASCNAYIEKLLSSLQAHVRRLFFHNSIILTEKSIREHEQVIQLMVDGKADEVTTVMKTNWLRAIDEFKSKQ